jgi:hypothetical protein
VPLAEPVHLSKDNVDCMIYYASFSWKHVCIEGRFAT